MRFKYGQNDGKMLYIIMVRILKTKHCYRCCLTIFRFSIQAMEFLTEVPSVKIEDILPFFPDFVTIDHFKSAIVESLQDYSKHITDLKVRFKTLDRSPPILLLRKSPNMDNNWSVQKFRRITISRINQISSFKITWIITCYNSYEYKSMIRTKKSVSKSLIAKVTL